MKIEDFCEIEECLVLIDDEIHEVHVNQIADKAVKLFFPLSELDHKVRWFSDVMMCKWELLEVLKHTREQDDE